MFILSVRLLDEDIFSPKSECCDEKQKPEASTSKQQCARKEKPKEFHKSFQRKQEEEALFGSDSNSDWSDLEGNRIRNLFIAWLLIKLILFKAHCPCNSIDMYKLLLVDC